MKKEDCCCGLLSCKQVNKKEGDHQFVLHPLPYEEDALIPYISVKTIQYHYGKHLATYIENTNRLKMGTPFEKLTLHEIIQHATGELFNNAAQVFNHYFYFEALHAAKDEKIFPKTQALIQHHFGSLSTFKEKFTQAGLSLFGSGWVWLVKDKGKLDIWAASNADNPLVHGKYPLLTLDVWEHAYYLDTQNARKKYIENFWKVVNWEIVEKRIH